MIKLSDIERLWSAQNPGVARKITFFIKKQENPRDKVRFTYRSLIFRKLNSIQTSDTISLIPGIFSKCFRLLVSMIKL